MSVPVGLVTDYSELWPKFWIKSNAVAPNLRRSWDLAPTAPLTVIVLDGSWSASSRPCVGA
jgi:hypothetical protein